MPSDPKTPITSIRPDWPAPRGVEALVTCRTTGCSFRPYDSFNLADHVGDEAVRVERNRQHLRAALELNHPIQWLEQVHGNRLVDANSQGEQQQADAVFTDCPGLACAVMTADCLPALFCDRAGSKVAVAHAGWRGLAAGILEITAYRFQLPMSELLVWLGPAICGACFETGPEVKAAFLAGGHDPQALLEAFRPSPRRENHDLTDLYQLARIRLAAIGVNSVYGGDYCSYTDQERFYSYRRDGVTGRNASIIYMKTV